MANINRHLIPVWPDAIAEVDVVKVSFVLDFLSACEVQPADFLGLGRTLRMTGRALVEPSDSVGVQQWKELFQPALSDDPVARRKFQKPSPAFVVSMPIKTKRVFNAGDRLVLDALFIGTGITSIHYFLKSLVHLGHLGLVAGEGRYEVTKIVCTQSDGQAVDVWHHNDPLESVVCNVQSLTWLVHKDRVEEPVKIRFSTPTRLMVDGKPLRKPVFSQIFPFMLRRVTSMLYAHSHIELIDDPGTLIEKAKTLDIIEAQYDWCDWRSLSSSQKLLVGGFTGEISLQGDFIEEIYWIIAVAELLGIGKGATYGAGRFNLISR